nr:GNAT family N-acetyltransferase [Microbacterium endophyticum]
MHATSPADSCHALDVDQLRHPSVTFWSAWIGDSVAGIAALKVLDSDRGEIKSMRADDKFRGDGVGRALLRHIIATARDKGLSSLWLETGTAPEFTPATRLYASEGFVDCGPFDEYLEDPHSRYMTASL